MSKKWIVAACLITMACITAHPASAQITSSSGGGGGGCHYCHTSYVSELSSWVHWFDGEQSAPWGDQCDSGPNQETLAGCHTDYVYDTCGVWHYLCSSGEAAADVAIAMKLGEEAFVIQASQGSAKATRRADGTIAIAACVKGKTFAISRRTGISVELNTVVASR